MEFRVKISMMQNWRNVKESYLELILVPELDVKFGPADRILGK